MSVGPLPDPFPAGAPERSAEIYAYLEQLFAYESFATSPRRTQLLRYLVDRTLAGEGSGLTEYAIGLDVFAKPPSFDPRLESVVRNEVMRLRQKLTAYYELQGGNDRIRIEIPKRSYVVIFSFRKPAEIPNPAVAVWKRALTVLGAALIVFAIVFAVIENSQKRVAKASYSENAAAEDLYLQGRYYWEKRTADSLPKAIDYFSRAIAKDPKFAKAYVGLADCYNLSPEFTNTPARDAFPKAMEAAKRAVQLDDGSAEAHASLAFASAYGAWDIQTAEREFNRAIALDPSYVPARHWRATLLLSIGRPKEAFSEIERARELYPASKSILADKGLILYNAGRREEALTLLKQIQTDEPSFPSSYRYLAGIYFGEKDIPDYFAQKHAFASLVRDPRALDVLQKTEKAYASRGLAGMLTAQESLNREGSLPAFTVSQTAALLNKEPETMAYLRKSLRDREPDLFAIRTELCFRKYYSDTEFQEIEKKVLGPVPAGH